VNYGQPKKNGKNASKMRKYLVFAFYGFSDALTHKLKRAWLVSEKHSKNSDVNENRSE
jgi:hypothetical protein